MIIVRLEGVEVRTNDCLVDGGGEKHASLDTP
jgi:hypothetical protein